MCVDMSSTTLRLKNGPPGTSRYETLWSCGMDNVSVSVCLCVCVCVSVCVHVCVHVFSGLAWL